VFFLYALAKWWCGRKVRDLYLLAQEGAPGQGVKREYFSLVRDGSETSEGEGILEDPV